MYLTSRSPDDIYAYIFFFLSFVSPYAFMCEEKKDRCETMRMHISIFSFVSLQKIQYIK